MTKQTNYKIKIVLLSVIAFLLLILVLQLAIKGANDSRVLLIKGEIDSIRIKNLQTELLLEKTSGEWFISEMQNGVVLQKSKADNDSVKAMQDFLCNINVVGKVSNSSDTERFGFGQNSIFVQVYKKGKLVRTLEIGKNASTNYQVFCHIDNKKETVLVSSDARSMFSSTFADLSIN